MLTHRGFSAWIEVNGKRLPEFLTGCDSTKNLVSCWIPGVEGQQFTIFWQDEGGGVDSCGFIFLDGEVIPGRYLFGKGTTWRNGIRSSQNTERPFIFKKVAELNADIIEENNSEAGMIIIKIARIVRTEAQASNPLNYIPETTLRGKRKAGDMFIGFGEDQKAQSQKPTTWSARPYDPSDGPTPRSYVTFVFRYRSPDFLEAQCNATGLEEWKTLSGKRTPSGTHRPANSQPVPAQTLAQPTPPSGMVHGMQLYHPGMYSQPYAYFPGQFNAAGPPPQLVAANSFGFPGYDASSASLTSLLAQGAHMSSHSIPQVVQLIPIVPMLPSSRPLQRTPTVPDIPPPATKKLEQKSNSGKRGRQARDSPAAESTQPVTKSRRIANSPTVIMESETTVKAVAEEPEELNESLSSASPLSSETTSSETTSSPATEDSPPAQCSTQHPTQPPTQSSTQSSTQLSTESLDIVMSDSSYLMPATPPPISTCSTVADLDFSCEDFLAGSSNLLEQLFDLNYYNC